MAVALIFAGGTGERMNAKTKPKQFLELHGKPILMHTIERFEEHPMVSRIAVVCLEDWIPECKKQIKRNFIEKVKWIVPGGKTGQESIYNGLHAMSNEIDEDEIVLIHDGVRPLITESLITQNIESVKEYGSAITVSYSTESVVTIQDKQIDFIPDREMTRIAKAPQSFKYGDIMAAHQQATNDNLTNVTDSATLMRKYGYNLSVVYGSPYNIKITTPSDYYIFRAIYEAKENSQIFGL